MQGGVDDLIHILRVDARHHAAGIRTGLLCCDTEELPDRIADERKAEPPVRQTLELKQHAGRPAGDFVNEIELFLEAVARFALLRELLNHPEVSQHPSVHHLAVHAGTRPQRPPSGARRAELHHFAVHPMARLVQRGQILRKHPPPQHIHGDNRLLLQARNLGQTGREVDGLVSGVVHPMPHLRHRLSELMQLDLPVHRRVGMGQRQFTRPQRLAGQQVSGDIAQVNQDVRLTRFHQHGRIQAHYAWGAVLHDQGHVYVHHPATGLQIAKDRCALLRVQPMAQCQRGAPHHLLAAIPGHGLPFAVHLDDGTIADPCQRNGLRAGLEDDVKHTRPHTGWRWMVDSSRSIGIKR